MRFDFDKNWFVIEVSFKLENFFFRFKSPSHFYRCLSQGNYRFLKESNRSFFKSFSDGYYRSCIVNDKINLIFFLRVWDNKKMISTSRELSIRIKKLIYSPVKIYDISDMNSTDLKLWSSSNGINSFKRILGNREE